MRENLESLGFSGYFRAAFDTLECPGLIPGRVVEAHAEHYGIGADRAFYRAEVTGALRHTLNERADFPTVGDWVTVAPLEAEHAAIHHVLPRKTELARRAVSGRSERQVIGANIDVALIVQSADRDFNPNRLERYLAVAYGAGIEPILVLSKTDLASSAMQGELLATVQRRHPSLEILDVNCVTPDGLERLAARIEPAQTYCLLGSSGTGKSTLINALLGEERLETQAISDWNQRGRHTTTSRTLLVLPGGGIVIDTPGMRELGGADGGQGLEKTFEDIHALMQGCRFSDCRHEGEPGCAVQAAITAGTLDPAKFDNFQRMEREMAHFEASASERRKKDRNQGRMIKRILGEKNRQRFGD